MQIARMKTKSIFLCAVFLIFLFSLSPIVYAQTLEVITVSTPQFNELMKTYPEVMVLDIRTPDKVLAWLEEKQIKEKILKTSLNVEEEDKLRKIIER